MRRFISALAIATLCASGTVCIRPAGARKKRKKAGEATQEARQGRRGRGEAHRQGNRERDEEGGESATKDAVQHNAMPVPTERPTRPRSSANACKAHGGVKVQAKVKS